MCVEFVPRSLDLNKTQVKLFRPKSFWTEVYIGRMEFVVEDVHDPGGEEGSPPDDDQVGDLGLCELMGVPMHIY